MLVKEGIKKYEKYLKVTRSEGTLRYYLGKVGILQKYLGDHNIEDIDNDLILDFVSDQRDRNPDISNRTINKYISTLRQIARYNCKIEIGFDKLPEVNKTQITIPKDIIEIIFKYYRYDLRNIYMIRNYLMFRLFYETGLRLNELLHLKVNDFNLQRNVIHVKKTKTSNERYVFFSEETKELFSEYIGRARITYFLFIDFISGTILKHYSVETICRRLRKELKINQSITPHKWRHTFATAFPKRMVIWKF